MSLSDKIKNSKRGTSLFNDVPPSRVYALKICSKISTMIFNERKRREMSQTEFADLCGVTQAMVSKWESGENNFSITAWAELAYRLGLPFDPAASSATSNSSIKSTRYTATSSRASNTQYSYTKGPNLIDFNKYLEAIYTAKEN